MAAQQKGPVRPVRVHLPDRDLMTTRVRGVGFRQTCDLCGVRVRGKTVRAVRDSMREHRAAAHSG